MVLITRGESPHLFCAFIDVFSSVSILTHDNNIYYDASTPDKEFDNGNWTLLPFQSKVTGHISLGLLEYAHDIEERSIKVHYTCI